MIPRSMDCRGKDELDDHVSIVDSVFDIVYKAISIASIQKTLHISLFLYGKDSEERFEQHNRETSR